MKKFVHDKNFLLKYFVGNIVVFSTLIGVLLLSKHISFAPKFGLISLLLIPLGVIWGLVVSTAFHNASHRNIKPLWLNELVGELAGAYTLEGMRNFRIGHMLHHMHSDDLELDPHSPGTQTFFQFLVGSKKQTIECLKRQYFKNFGETEAMELDLMAQIFSHHASTVVKLVFWFLLFGPTGFVFFFVPSFFSYFLGFGHLNYISHLPDQDGIVRIKDHHDGWYYMVMNVITSGGYFHKSHHEKPWLYNPSRLQL